MTSDAENNEYQKNDTADFDGCVFVAAGQVKIC